MRFLRILTIATALTALSVGATHSNAATLTGLFNTGVNGSGVATAPGTLDIHYSVVASPDTPATGPSFSVGPNNVPPIPPWALDTATYNWTSGPVGPGVQNPTPNGVYDYQTTFGSTDGGIVTITGTLSADDQVIGIKINGLAAITTGLPTTDQGYAALYAFSATGVTALTGTNTLDFLVNNTHTAVEGLLVTQISGSTPVGIPEPTSIVMLGLGMGGLGLVRFRHRFTRA